MQRLPISVETFLFLYLVMETFLRFNFLEMGI
jgi:hypothetical protein